MMGAEQGGPMPEEFKSIREKIEDEKDDDEGLTELMEEDSREEYEQEEDLELGNKETEDL